MYAAQSDIRLHKRYAADRSYDDDEFYYDDGEEVQEKDHHGQSDEVEIITSTNLLCLF